MALIYVNLTSQKHQDAQDGLKRPRDGPKKRQEGPKRAPGGPQDAPKSLPRGFQKQIYVNFTSQPPKKQGEASTTLDSFPSTFVGRPRAANLNRPTKVRTKDETEWDLRIVYWEGFFIPSPLSPPPKTPPDPPPGKEVQIAPPLTQNANF